MIQHAAYCVPNYRTGYTTDDNARALIVAARYHRLYGDDRSRELVNRYLSFLFYVQREDGRFHNVLNYDRRYGDEVGSEDCQGRALWGLGYASRHAPWAGQRRLAGEMLDDAVPWVPEISHARATAFAILGLSERWRSASEAKCHATLRLLGDRLVETYRSCRSPQWDWFEESLTYDNPRLCEALFLVYEATGEEIYRKTAERTLSFYFDRQWDGERFWVVGNQGWFTRNGECAPFDQQPVEAAAAVEAAAVAYRVTGRAEYIAQVQGAFAWFEGQNVVGALLADEATGGCHDGLHEKGVNRNQGAESTLAALQAALTMEELRRIGALPLAARRGGGRFRRGRMGRAEGAGHPSGPLRAFRRR